MATTVKPFVYQSPATTSSWTKHDMYTVPAGKVAKIEFDVLTVDNSENGNKSYNWKGMLLVDGVMIDAYQFPNTANNSAYTIYPAANMRGVTHYSGSNQSRMAIYKSDYNTYVPTLSTHGNVAGFALDRVYLNAGEVLELAIWQSASYTYKFNFRGLLTLEDITA